MSARTILLAGAALLATGLDAQAQAPPRPPERPTGIGHLDMHPPLPVVRPPADEEAGSAEEPAEEPAARDAPTEDAPIPPARRLVDEPEAVLPDAPREPLETGPAERAAHEACLSDLAALEVAWEEHPRIDGEGACGAAFPIRVTAIGGIALSPAITVVCPVARALARWSEDALVPAADAHLDARITTLYTAGSYVCRGRNRDPDAKLSEHAFANAVDLTGVDFETRAAVPVAPRDGAASPEARFQREIRREACVHFRTVLGPGADAYHDDHLHLDQRQRTNDYRLCE